MVDTDTARTIIGFIGNVISLCLFLSPMPTFVKIIKQGAVQDFKPDPYLATVLNCAIWAFYGMPFVKPDSILVLTINATGLFIEIIYVIVFFIFSPAKKRIKIVIVLLIEIAFMTVVVLIAMLASEKRKTRAMFVGLLCIVFNILMYTSPLTVMRMVIKTKSVKYMPFFLSLANFLNGIIWTAYALLKFDINIVLPNALGAFSGLVQLILYGTFYRTTNWDDKENDDDALPRYNPKTEVELSNSSSPA